MNKDTIYRQAAIDAVRSYYDECDTSDKSIEERIEDLPSAQPERKKGHWIRIAPRHYKCSECGVRASSSFANFCHRCGSDMRGEKNG